MYQTIRRDYIDVLGYIWMPNNVLCAQRIELREYDLQNIVADQITGDVPITDETLTERFTRDNVEQWVSLHAGDFSRIVDFYATAGHVDIPWASEDNEIAFDNAMYGSED